MLFSTQLINCASDGGHWRKKKHPIIIIFFYNAGKRIQLINLAEFLNLQTHSGRFVHLPDFRTDKDWGIFIHMGHNELLKTKRPDQMTNV